MSLSAPQIALTRTEQQRSVLGLAVLNPKIVLACQITDYTGTDMVNEFTFGSVTSGSYADVLPGQIVYVGTSAGAYDVGICRVRKAWTSDTAYTSEESSIDFANGRYITVVDAFDPRPRHLVVTADETFMDVDVDYSDQHTNFDPVVIMGGQVVVDAGQSYPVAVNFPAIADTWVFDDTIASYLTEASEGVVTNETTTDPTLTISSYPTNGYIRVSTTATTTTGGKSFTGYRYVFVFDDTHRPITDFVLNDCGCSRDEGDWSANITLNDSNDFASLRFGGLAVLFAKDYYNGSPDVVGLYAGRENILMSGWIYEKTSVNDPEHPPRSFDIKGLGFWLSRMSSFPTGVELSTSAATVWTEMANLTVDRGLYHYLHWRTTVTQIADVYLTDDTKYTGSTESAAANIWQQITDIANQILAEPTCNYNGMLTVKVPYNLMPSADRAANSTLVMALTGQDFNKTTEILQTAPQIAQVILSGVVADEFGNANAVFSLSPGHVPALLGDLLPVPNMLLEDQTQANKLAGLVFASQNNPYPSIPLTLNGTNRAFDIAPVLYGTVTDLDEYSGTIVPVSVDYYLEDGKLEIEAVFEGETDETDAIYVNGDVPDGNGGFVSIPNLGKLPPLDPIDLPDIPTFPTTPGSTDTPCSSNWNNYYSLVWSKPYLDGADSNKLVSNANFSCKLRGSPNPPSYLVISIHAHGDAYNLPDVNVSVYGMLGGSKVATGTISPFGSSSYQLYVQFYVGSDTLVDGFQIELTSGIGSLIESATPGDTVNSGSVNATSEVGADIPTTAGNGYCIDGTGGPWDNGAGSSNLHGYSLDGSGYMGDGTLTLPSVSFYGETINATYSRAYFIAPDTDINFRVADAAGQFADNSGTLGYLLRQATVVGRALNIYGATINNVCAP